MKRNYSIGLDIGVGSVGWACLDENFQPLNYQGQYAIGVREFESADTAEERRLLRGMRRRYSRRIRRLQLLQETLSPLFSDDLNFLRQTEEQKEHYWRNSNKFENRTLSETLNSLNLNKRSYPTIYHLRTKLMKENKKYNPRLIYLALHHLVKFRGHFLNENMSWIANEEKDSIGKQIENFLSTCSIYVDGDDLSDNSDVNIEEIVLNSSLTNSDKRREIVKKIGKVFQPYISLILGLKVDVSNLFPQSEQAEAYKKDKLKISFSDEDISEVYESLLDEEQQVIDDGNKVYQNILLNDLLGEYSTVAEAKVASYEKFGKDLKQLKDIYYNNFDEKIYKELFVSSKEAWKAFENNHDKKELSLFDQFLKTKSDFGSAFYKRIENDLKKLLDKDLLSEKERARVLGILNELELNQFLQRQKSFLNSAIPHQNNVYEAVTILKKQKQYHPEITDEMISRVEKIIQFRIPYYVGPLIKNKEQSEFAWSIRKRKDVPVLPWDFDEVIDKSESAKEFIESMTNYCVYLKNEKVLPKRSLNYEMFEVLNELNGIQIRTSNDLPNSKYKLDFEVKSWIIENVFKKRKSVTHKQLIEALKNSPYEYVVLDYETDSYKEIFGTQKEDRFVSNLASYIDMKKIFGDINESNKSMIEEVIYWITIFEDKNIIKLKLNEKYSHLSEEQVRQIVNLNYSGWGRLSNRLLDELPVDLEENLTFLEVLKKESKVFMEILAVEKYDLDNRIKKLNESKEEVRKIKYEDIDSLHGSPAIKKSIWQASLIVEELVEIFGEPNNIMIEFAREEGIKRRTEDRKKKISEIQRKASQKDKDIKEFLKETSKYEKEEFQNDRFFLYVTQNGKCMYSGEPLIVTQLNDYEIDHIFPRHFVKDDSIDNRVLVKKKMNQAKTGTKMPLEILTSEQKVKQKLTWKRLYENNLISQKKYYRLLKEEFTDQDKESFFARQLVETRQITKHVKDILQERLPKTEIHTVNANIVSNLRKHMGLTKIRSLNNKHHATDAWLTALVVQFIINKHGHNFLEFNFKYQKAHEKWKKMLTQQKENFFLFQEIDKYEKFAHPLTGEILPGRLFLKAIDHELPWVTTKKIGSGEGAFYKQTLFSPKSNEAKYKSNKTSKGVYKEMKNECSYLISYEEVNKNGRSIKKSLIVDYYVIEKYQNRGLDGEELAMFLAKKDAKNTVKKAMIHSKLHKFQRLLVNNYPFYFVSSREAHNAKQLELPSEILDELSNVFINDEEKDKASLQELFKSISNIVNEEFEQFLPEKSREKIVNYYKEIVDRESFLKAFEELMKTTSASAARSTVFGYRYSKVIPPKDLKVVHQSITGLKRRKPKSFRHELWKI